MPIAIWVAVKRSRRLFTKNTGLRKVVSDAVWGLTPAQCRKVKEVGQVLGLKLTTEAPVNGGRNYNGPKVAKFLVG